MSKLWAWACFRAVMAWPGNPAPPPHPWWQPSRIYWAALPWAGQHAYGEAQGDE